MRTIRVGLYDGDGRAVFILDACEGVVSVQTGNGRNVELIGDLGVLVAFLRALDRHKTPLIPVVRERPRPQTSADAVLLLALAARWPCLVLTDDFHRFEPLHLTLAYALPLALDDRWQAWASDHAELLIQGDQIVTVPASDLVAVAPADDEWRYRRLLRRHMDTKVVEHDDLGDFLNRWSEFTTWRYGRPLPQEESAALQALLGMSGCVVREFLNCGEVIARSVVCVHEPSRTVFDLMATWHPRHARLRPGIFSAVYNLVDARGRGFRFSLCYGQFPYKNTVIGNGIRLTLQDLIFAGERSVDDQLIQDRPGALSSGNPFEVAKEMGRRLGSHQ